jgi:uncharacterized protein YjiS (DUF1127 family)
MIAGTKGAYRTTADARAAAPGARLLAALLAAVRATRRRTRDRALLAEMAPYLARDVGLADAGEPPTPPPGRMPDFW